MTTESKPLEYGDHPASRLLWFIDSILAKRNTMPEQRPASYLWQAAIVTPEQAGVPPTMNTYFTTSIQHYFDTLDEWKQLTERNNDDNISASLEPTIDALTGCILDMPTTTSGALCKVLAENRRYVATGLMQPFTPERSWTVDQLEEIKKQVRVWQRKVKSLKIDEIQKESILEALEDVLFAIDYYPTVGPTRFDKLMTKVRGVLITYQPALVNAGITAALQWAPHVTT